jgi:hypothetical protein
MSAQRLEVSSVAEHERRERAPDEVQAVSGAGHLDTRSPEEIRQPTSEEPPIPALAGLERERNHRLFGDFMRSTRGMRPGLHVDDWF